MTRGSASPGGRPPQTPPRWAAATAVSAVLTSALVTACSGTGGQPAPSPPSPTSSCHPGVSGAENWIMGNGELSAVQSASLSSVSYAVSPAHLMVLELRGQTSSAGQMVADFRSYAELKEMIKKGTIPAGIHWLMYDNEQWPNTPADEQADPVRYEQLFARLAHRHGYKVILAPAQDLVPGFDKNGFRSGKPAWPSYLSLGLAATSARVADIYEIQAQPYEIGVYRSSHAYASFVAAAAAPAQLLQDYQATRGLVDGYWLNIPRHNQPGPVALANQFFRNLPASASASGAACAGT